MTLTVQKNSCSAGLQKQTENVFLPDHVNQLKSWREKGLILILLNKKFPFAAYCWAVKGVQILSDAGIFNIALDLIFLCIFFFFFG